MMRKLFPVITLCLLFFSCNNIEYEYSEVESTTEVDSYTGGNIVVFQYLGENISGTIIDRRDNGNLNFKMEVRNGVLHGMSIYYNDSGNVKSEERYLNGLRQGVHRIYTGYGSTEGRFVFQERLYKDDVLHGVFKVYWSDQQLRERTNYSLGRRHGLHEEWDRDGNLISQKYYEYGQEVNR